MIRVGVEPLRRLVSATFQKAGCPAEEGDRIALYLSKANLTGHDSHGVIRVPRYIEWLATGWLAAGQRVATVLDTGPLLILDAQRGFGQSAGPEATALGIARAGDHGLAVVALRNSGHLGRIGDFAEMAIDAGLVSIHFVNAYGSVLVAPFGARERRFSTNPLCIGIPTGDDRPFVLDFATALVAEGKILVAAQGGKPVPVGSMVTAEGELTNDPQAVYGPPPWVPYPDPRKGAGAMRAFGEHKGSGLALACELLAGALTGSGSTRKTGVPFHNGMLSIYLDPARMDTESTFAAEVRAFVDDIRTAAPIDPAEPVMIPGDKERKTAAERTRDGIPLPPETWELLLGAARRVGLGQAEIDALLA